MRALKRLVFASLVIAWVAACSSATTSSTPPPTGGGATLGQPYEGGLFHLGPVDWQESAFHNACAPGDKYKASVQQAEGDLLVGLWNGIPNVAEYCDACILVTTKKGKSALLRVVTYGDTTSNSIDVSPAAYQLLNSGEDPRAMSWQFAECNDTGKIMYEFQTGASEYWTSLWVRNARLPIAKIEVQSANHKDWFALRRAGDGTLNDDGGFGKGDFTFRITSIDGKVVTEKFTWPTDAAGVTGKMLIGKTNF